MTVGELKEKLKDVDDSLQVAVYESCSEEMGIAERIEIEERGSDDLSYCKADHVFDYVDNIGDKVLVISS